jgi:ClpP class serine protease
MRHFSYYLLVALLIFASWLLRCASCTRRDRGAPSWLRRGFRGQSDGKYVPIEQVSTKKQSIGDLLDPRVPPSRRRWMSEQDHSENHNVTSTDSKSAATRITNATQTSSPPAVEQPKNNPKEDGGARIWPWSGKTRENNSGVRVLKLVQSEEEEKEAPTASSTREPLDVQSVNPFDSLVRWQQSWFHEDEADVDSSSADKSDGNPQDGVRILRLLRSKSEESIDSDSARDEKVRTDKGEDQIPQAEQGRIFGLTKQKEEMEVTTEKLGRAEEEPDTINVWSSWFSEKNITDADNGSSALDEERAKSSDDDGKTDEKKRTGFSFGFARQASEKNMTSDETTESHPDSKGLPWWQISKEGSDSSGDVSKERMTKEQTTKTEKTKKEASSDSSAEEEQAGEPITVKRLDLPTKRWWPTPKADSGKKLNGNQGFEKKQVGDSPKEGETAKSFLLELDTTEATETEKETDEPLKVERLDLAGTSLEASPSMLSTKQEQTVQKPEENQEEEVPELQKKADEPARNETKTETEAPEQASNATAQTTPQPTGFIMQPQHHAPSMIVLGGGAPPEGYGRGTAMPGGRRHVQPTTTTIMVEAFASIVSAALRIWFLTSLTKWWQEEESMKPMQHFVWEQLNDRYVKDEAALKTVLRSPPTGITPRRWRFHLDKERRRERKLSAAQDPDRRTAPVATMFDRTVVVVELSGDDSGRLNIPHLQQVVTFILSQHRQKAFGSYNLTAKELEVVILVESPGGAVQDFGLAAAQVDRLTSEDGIKTTVCVDKIAASGGYMISSQAEQLLAAPFAIVGSVGVIRESMNIHDALVRHGNDPHHSSSAEMYANFVVSRSLQKKYDIQPLVLKAGNSKAPLTATGPITRNDIRTAQVCPGNGPHHPVEIHANFVVSRSLQKTLDTIHKAFQRLVVQGRPMLEDSVNQVCTGDIYLGQEARELRLVDRVLTSEEYLLERIQAGDRVLKLHRSHQHQYAKHRRLFSPLDFIWEKTRSVRTALSNLSSRDDNSIQAESIVAQLVTASSFISFANYLVRHRLFTGP